MERDPRLNDPRPEQAVDMPSRYGAHAEAGRGHIEREVPVRVDVGLGSEGGGETGRIGHWGYYYTAR